MRVARYSILALPRQIRNLGYNPHDAEVNDES